MSGPSGNRRSASCSCGSVEFKATGAPITSVVCYCDDCQEGSRQIEALPKAPAIRDPDGGTAYILYRKDRVECTKGESLLKNHKIRGKSATNRVVATCCNSAMFLDFTKGHWLSMFRNRFAAGAPPLEMRVMTKERRAGVALADDVPNFAGFSGKFMLKLIAAWIALFTIDGSAPTFSLICSTAASPCCCPRSS